MVSSSNDVRPMLRDPASRTSLHDVFHRRARTLGLPDVWSRRGLSISRIAVIRLYILAGWFAKTVSMTREQRRRLMSTRGLRGTCGSQEALIIATGPSALGLDTHAALKMQARGGKIFALNFYNEMTLSEKVIPDFYVLTDPRWFDQASSDGRIEATWNYIKENSGIVIVAPATIEHIPLAVERSCVFVNTIGLDGWTRNTDPTRARGYVGLTAFAAMAIAQFMGFSSIFLCGFDSDAFRSIVLDESGDVALAANHGYAENSTTKLLPIDSVGEALEFYARHFYDLKLFEQERFINLDPSSLVQSIRSGRLLASDSGPIDVDG